MQNLTNEFERILESVRSRRRRTDEEVDRELNRLTEANRAAWTRNALRAAGLSDSEVAEVDELPALLPAIDDVLEGDAQGAYIWGPSGTGKSTQLRAAVAAAVRKFAAEVPNWQYQAAVPKTIPPALYITESAMFRELRSSVGTGDHDAIFDRFCSVHLLALDEVGISKTSEFVGEDLHEIIDRRYRFRRPTLFASNIPFTAPGEERIGKNGRREMVYPPQLCRNAIYDAPVLQRITKMIGAKKMGEVSKTTVQLKKVWRFEE